MPICMGRSSQSRMTVLAGEDPSESECICIVLEMTHLLLHDRRFAFWEWSYPDKGCLGLISLTWLEDRSILVLPAKNDICLAYSYKEDKEHKQK